MVYGIPGRGQGGVAAPVLGRVGALRVRDGRGAVARGRRRGRCTRCAWRRSSTSSPPSGSATSRIPEWAWEAVAASWRRQRPARLRPLRPALRRRRPGQAAGVQRRHPHHAARGVDPAVALAEGRPSRRRPVELAAREARRAVGRDPRGGCPATTSTSPGRAATPPARTTSRSATCRRRRPRRGSTRSGCRSRTSAGTRRWSASSTSKRHFDVGGVQALPVGVGAHRRLRQARARRRCPRRCGSSRCGRRCCPTRRCSRCCGRCTPATPTCCPPTSTSPGMLTEYVRKPRLGPGGRQHRDRRAGLGDADRRRLRRGGLRLPALRPAARVRRLPARAGRVDRRRHRRRASASARPSGW